MIVVVFRSRLRPENQDAYAAEASVIDPLAHDTPGLISVKTFAAPDGERVTIAEFESEEAVSTWREHPRHREAQAKGRQLFYSEYRLQVCDVVRERRFAAGKAAGAGDALSS
jgi:heme-degrading monooxygenase HmoA